MIEGGHPGVPELLKGDPQGFASWKYDHVASGHEMRPNLPRQLSEETLCTISPHRRSQPLSHNDTNTTGHSIWRGGRTRDQVKEWSLKPATYPFHPLQFGRLPQKQEPIPGIPGHKRAPRR